MGKSIKTYLKSAAKDYVARSVNPPVVRASTILFKTMQELRKHQKDIAKGKEVAYWDYGRQGSQTTIQLQKILKELEQAHYVFLTQTGFGSVALAIMSVCRPGDEIVISDCVYRPTQKLTSQLLKEFNIKTIWYNPNSFQDLKNKISKKTKINKYVLVIAVFSAIQCYLPSSLPLAVPGYTASFLIRPDLMVSYRGRVTLLPSNSKFTSTVPLLSIRIF